MIIGVDTRSSVNFEGGDRARHFCPNIYAWKNNKIPECCMIFARKIFSLFFGGGGAKCHLPLLRLTMKVRKTVIAASATLLSGFKVESLRQWLPDSKTKCWCCHGDSLWQKLDDFLWTMSGRLTLHVQCNTLSQICRKRNTYAAPNMGATYLDGGEFRRPVTLLQERQQL